jgi:hypothetical protein
MQQAASLTFRSYVLFLIRYNASSNASSFLVADKQSVDKAETCMQLLGATHIISSSRTSCWSTKAAVDDWAGAKAGARGITVFTFTTADNRDDLTWRGRWEVLAVGAVTVDGEDSAAVDDWAGAKAGARGITVFTFTTADSRDDLTWRGRWEVLAVGAVTVDGEDSAAVDDWAGAGLRVTYPVMRIGRRLVFLLLSRYRLVEYFSVSSFFVG